MNVKLIFREASKKLISDFNISAQINHSGSTGTYREGSLKRFLEDGRVPRKYSIGFGEIVGSNSDTSKQADLIFYDKENCPVIVFGESIQVFPSESVYGVIEVKSKLSKQKLIEGLENIASYKKLVPKNNSATRPFGIIFAYSLGGNSLESLEKNLKEYESKVDCDLWPNMVVVLNEGIIFHMNRLKNSLRSEEFNINTRLISIHFKEDTLFEFYLSLFDLLTNSRLGKLNLRKYKELPKQVGNHYVIGHDKFVDRGSGNVFELKEEFIEKVYNHCTSLGNIEYKQVLLLQFGSLPQGVEEKDVAYKVYYYNPDNLPGYHEVENPVRKDGDTYIMQVKSNVPSHTITIDGENFIIPRAYFNEEDMQIREGVKSKDL
ncbi:DUF6602 domain-containing protein [Saccharibacillus sp. JS10]|uniref:DUF6602 domain-containing protein n=1 Tax=Saccharibacillus sp. JS10 TaxID=2950552 RepID=UPI00210ADE85|nr:DUF6602 domain-containing protein [Saccharibacillus sp. JS10]MCQ4088448.1 hypothetical protein [Saccharibacillus sp. JS10]